MERLNSMFEHFGLTVTEIERLLIVKKVKDFLPIRQALEDLKNLAQSEASKIDQRAFYDGRLSADRAYNALGSFLQDLDLADEKLGKLFKASRFFKGEKYFGQAALVLQKHLQNGLVVAFTSLLPPRPVLPPPLQPPAQHLQVQPTQQSGRSPTRGPVTTSVETSTEVPADLIGNESTLEEDLASIPEERSELDPWMLTVNEAEAGSADEAFIAAVAYLTGDGLPEGEQIDKPRGLRYLKSAAQSRAGNGQAMHLLGRIFEQGDPDLVSRPDLVKAASLYERAAGLNHRAAMTDFAFCLEHGIGCEPDPSTAAVWYSKAGLHGCTVAQNNLGTMALQGRGLERSETRAFELFHAAKDAGSAGAMHNLGLVYQEGLGVPSDKYQAELLFEAAARKGHTPAALNLARLLAVRRRPHEALGWLQAALPRGVADGCIGELCFLLANVQENLYFNTPIDIDGSYAGSRLTIASSPSDLQAGPSPRAPHRMAPASGVLPTLPNPDDIAALYRFAADRGISGALLRLAHRAWDAGDTADAVSMYSAAARKGHPGAFEALSMALSGVDSQLATELMACGACLGSDTCLETLRARRRDQELER